MSEQRRRDAVDGTTDPSPDLIEDLVFESVPIPPPLPRALRGARAEREGAWTAERMHQAIWQALPYDGWSILEEVTTTPSQATSSIRGSAGANGQQVAEHLAGQGQSKPRRIDVLALRDPQRHTAADAATAQGLLGAVGGGAWNDVRTKPAARDFNFGLLRLLALEIKVTRADFRSDIARPDKQAPWRALAHQHAYAVPEGLVDVSEVPDGSGLLEIRKQLVHASWAPPGGEVITQARWARQPPYSDGGVDDALLIELLFRASSAEARLRGRTDPERSNDVGDLHEHIRRLNEEIERMKRHITKLEKALGRS